MEYDRKNFLGRQKVRIYDGREAISSIWDLSTYVVSVWALDRQANLIQNTIINIRKRK